MLVWTEVPVVLLFKYMPVVNFRSLWKAYKQIFERDLEQVVNIFKMLQDIGKKDNIPLGAVKLFLCNGLSTEIIVAGIAENLLSFLYETSISAAHITDLPCRKIVYVLIKHCKKISQSKPGHLRSSLL